MKTKIIVEIETKNMKEFREHENGEGKVMTDEVEKCLHRAIKTYFKGLETGKGVGHDNLEEDILSDSDELQIEGVEQFSDFGDIEIKVTVEKRT